MNKIYLTLLFLGINFCLAQEKSVKWDTTRRASNLKSQVDMFKSYTNSSKDIIFLGNSITARVNWNELLNHAEVKNRGISGDNTFGVLDRLDEVTEGKPAKVFILIGINDLGKHIPEQLVLDNYEKIIRRIKKESPLTKIYFQTLLPVNNTMRTSYNKAKEIKIVNQGLKNIAKVENITVIDLYPNFLDNDGQLMKTLTDDGLHLNPEGYKVWKRILLPYLK